MVVQHFTTYNVSDHVKRKYYINTEQSSEWQFKYFKPFFYDLDETGGYLSQYPKDEQKYLQYKTYRFPFNIYKGLDEYVYTCLRDGKKKKIQRHLWYLEFESHVTDKAQQFFKLSDAIKKGLDVYNKYLLNELKELNKKYNENARNKSNQRN